MGLLDKLWDNTVAGPYPDSRLGKLRKFNTFGPRGKDHYEDSAAEAAEGVKVTRSIMIVKPPGYQTAGSAPASPGGSTPPASPFSGNRSGAFKCQRKSMSDTNDKEASEDGSIRNTAPI